MSSASSKPESLPHEKTAHQPPERPAHHHSHSHSHPHSGKPAPHRNEKQPSSEKHHGWVLPVIVGVLVLGGGAWWYKKHVDAEKAKQAAAHRNNAVPVTAGKAEARDVDVVLTALGTVTPVSTVTLTSRVAGVLKEVHYTEGQMVKQNDLLAVIDPRPYEAALAQAKGQLTKDQAVLANARIDLDRYQTAFKEHAIPEQQVATQQAVVEQDQGVVKLDEAGVEAAQVNVDYTRITSPTNGRVGLRMVDPGNNVQANGTSGLVSITQLQPITVIFPLAQDYLSQVMTGLKKGQPMRVEAYDRTSAKPVGVGQLLTIDNQVEQASGTFRLKAVFPNEDTALWPGQFVNLRFIVSVDQKAVTVPSRAVQRGPKGDYLFVIKPDSSVEMRTISVGQTDQDTTVVTKGLKPDERIVVDGQYRLEDKTKITVQEPGQNNNGNTNSKNVAASPVTPGKGD